ncbi:MAG: S41 family peptidase [Bacteroidia bacterium]|nr:S41 family peptidase [Bacteroidia bacterium]MCZ2248697.1 S41 family peptidase [Bacteroidia bacterium]
MENNNNKHNPFYPLYFALVLVVGVLIGITINRNSQQSRLLQIFSNKNFSANKVDEVMNYVLKEYVDSINKDSLTDKTIEALLSNLDPHSVYIPAEILQATVEPLNGNFEGIGIEFNILRDTIYVANAIPGGPSEKAGIKSGDKIIFVDGKKVAGIGITNEMVFKTLKGKGGTEVNIGILPLGTSKIEYFKIIRGKIPIHSIDASYMIDSITGYINIIRFGSTTYNEFDEALLKLEQKGMKQLVLDLRGNPGGYLDAAIHICDEFLPEGKTIVYTEGKSRPRKTSVATKKGRFEKQKLVILIDESSASASEIVAGAIQDNDRGLIIGRRSFGKGLVQEQSEFRDGSAIRLTIARYYTPSGRSIQKPYVNGKSAEYYHKEAELLDSGELINKDSVKLNLKLKYTTANGRTVYGGGGIMPDIFVPLDTTKVNRNITRLIYSKVVNDFAMEYVNKNRAKLSYQDVESFNKSFVINTALLDELRIYANKYDVKFQVTDLNKDFALFSNIFKALIAKNIFNQEAWFYIKNQNDDCYKKAIETIYKENNNL